VLLSLDISVAFDTLDHDLSLNRATELFGLSGQLIDWFESYLTGRTMQLHFCWQLSFVYCLLQNRSSTGFISWTTPVFRVYHICQSSYICIQRVMSPIHSCIHPLICRPTMTSTTCRTVLMHICARWHLENNLLLNPSTTEALVTDTRQHVAKFENSTSAIRKIYFANTVVPCSKSVHVLGVTIDSQLTFDKYVTIT